MSRPHILVVDDQESARKYIKHILAPLNPEISEAADGQEACGVIENGTDIDLVISDIDMPRMNGYQFCSALKQNGGAKKIPLVLVSCFDSDDYIERGFESGADAFVSKRSARDTLEPVVQQILNKSKINRNRRILVADDSPVVRKIVESNLSQAGFDVRCAENGRQALSMLRGDSFDLILSDLKMPELNGVTFCDRVRGDERLSKIPFVVMSASEERRHVKRLMHQGIAGFIIKPFHPDELTVLIERILSDQFQLLLKEKENLANERKMMLASITSLVYALEARDTYTMGHSDSVAEIVTGMARIAGIYEQEELQLLTIGAKLHDIGKIGVRDAVLHKAGKLTEEEYDHIKRHSETGANILSSIPSLAPILPLVLHHHERYDGGGYPHGLKGTDIPFWARMTAVADTYDAMTSDRPYRQGMPHEKAVSVIREVSGSQLCPVCVNLFLQYLGEYQEESLASAQE